MCKRIRQVTQIDSQVFHRQHAENSPIRPHCWNRLTNDDHPFEDVPARKTLPGNQIPVARTLILIVLPWTVEPSARFDTLAFAAFPRSPLAPTQQPYGRSDELQGTGMEAKKPLSKTQIDKLGVRLKNDDHPEVDLRMLDDYRFSFSTAYESALETIRGLGEFPTGRVAKTTQSISAKLRRESLRLSQMQDIAGCRIIVPDIAAQNQLVAALEANFPLHTMFDRREKPSHGYRAVHLVVQVLGLPVEIQVRTTLQQSWAELCEKAADRIDSEIKYGGGPADWRTILEACSKMIFEHEMSEIVYTELETKDAAASDELKQRILAKCILLHKCIYLAVRCEELFGSFTPSEFSTLTHSDKLFCAHVEDMLEDLDLIIEDLDLKDGLQTPRSLEQILVHIRRSREKLTAKLTTDQASLVDLPPRRIEATKHTESNRTKIFEVLSVIADLLNSHKKLRTENPQ